jgi:phosphate transport system permease protein
MFWTLLALLVALAVACFVAGRVRAIALSGGASSSLHSLPSYHGGFLAAAAAGPALIFFFVWQIVAPRVEERLIFDRLGSAIQNFSTAQLETLWRDIRLLAHGGGSPSVNDALRQRGVEAYASVNAASDTLMLIGIVVLVAVGLFVGWGRLSLHFRARHVVEAIVKAAILGCAAIAIFTTIGIVASLIAESLRFFTMVSPIDFLFGLTWTPQQMAFRADQVGGTAAFGFVPLFTGTLLITAIAIGVAAPLGILSAIYLSDYASSQVRAVGKPVLEVLAGIPTVVYGFFAALTVAPFIRNAGQSFGLDVSSESALAAGVVMGIMIVPFVSSLSDDVINAVPQSLRDGSLAMGATKSETIVKVVLPAALPGIVSALILAISKAIGETMIVVMAAGMAANLTFNPLEAVTTVTVQIGTLLTGDQEFDSPKTLVAFALGLVLFAITLALNVYALYVVKRYREQYD